MAPRSYRQQCGLARALDVLGERWTMLIIRELVLGPKRFGDLAERLPGIGTNLLTDRLRALEDAGVIARTTLPAPAGVQVYALTDRGHELEEPLALLATWGFDLLTQNLDGVTARAAWAALSMRTVHNHSDHPAPDGVYAFDIDGEQFHVAIAGGRASVTDGPPAPTVPVATHTAAPLMVFYGLATRQLTVPQARRTPGVTIDEPRALTGLLRTFHLPGGG